MSSLVKFSKITLLKHILHMINQSLEEGLFPISGKLAIVKHIYKKGSCHLVQIYCAILLLPSISKIFEKIVGLQEN